MKYAEIIVDVTQSCDLNSIEKQLHNLLEPLKEEHYRYPTVTFWSSKEIHSDSLFAFDFNSELKSKIPVTRETYNNYDSFNEFILNKLNSQSNLEKIIIISDLYPNINDNILKDFAKTEFIFRNPKNGVYKKQQWGNTYYYQFGELHREDGPAIERNNGDKEWWVNGERHRIDGPAILKSNGAEYWYLNNDVHRDNGPAQTFKEDDVLNQLWWQNGVLHREDGPAILKSNGEKQWFLNGVLHREDGPAIENFNKPDLLVGTFNFKFDLLGSQILENLEGANLWFQNNTLHRIDGPAVVRPDGTNNWFLNDQHFTEHEFLMRTNKVYAVESELSNLSPHDLNELSNIVDRMKKLRQNDSSENIDNKPKNK